MLSAMFYGNKLVLLYDMRYILVTEWVCCFCKKVNILLKFEEEDKMADQELTYQRLINYLSTVKVDEDYEWIQGKNYSCSMCCAMYKYTILGKNNNFDENGIEGHYGRWHVINWLNKNITIKYVKKHKKEENIYIERDNKKSKYFYECNEFDTLHKNCYYCMYEPECPERFKAFMNEDPEKSTDVTDFNNLFNIRDYDLRLWICIALGLIKMPENKKWEDAKAEYFNDNNFWNKKRKNHFEEAEFWKSRFSKTLTKTDCEEHESQLINI